MARRPLGEPPPEETLIADEAYVSGSAVDGHAVRAWDRFPPGVLRLARSVAFRELRQPGPSKPEYSSNWHTDRRTVHLLPRRNRACEGHRKKSPWLLGLMVSDLKWPSSLERFIAAFCLEHAMPRSVRKPSRHFSENIDVRFI